MEIRQDDPAAPYVADLLAQLREVMREQLGDIRRGRIVLPDLHQISSIIPASTSRQDTPSARERSGDQPNSASGLGS